ncbi:MAG: signal recognition particle protein Srp19 [Candidatus Thermoplasmatota archaeon]|nr:signal recognition particle protein Srp19 [Candidatus Thermoplasmatota archaeon]
MVSRDESKVVLYPLYFDATVSRLKGRKVSRKNAVDKPSIESLAKAAQSLGLHPVIEKHASHPSTPWKSDGRVLVEHKGPKSQLLAQVALRL